MGLNDVRVVHVCGTFTGLSETFIYDAVLSASEQVGSTLILCGKRVDQLERPLRWPIIEVGYARGVSLRRAVIRAVGILWGYPSPASKLNEETRLYLKSGIWDRCDLVHAHFGPQGIKVAPICRKYDLPLVVSFHGFDAYRLPKNRWWRDQYRDELFSNPRVHCTVVSEHMREVLISLGASQDRTHLCRVGKDLGSYALAHPGERENFILFDGRMTEKKGVLDLLNAFSIVVNRLPDVKLILVGDGPQISSVKHHISSKGLERNVCIKGSLDHSQVIELMRKAQLFVLLSKTADDGDCEGVPTVLMEAQAMGLPIVSTTHTGIPEVVPTICRDSLVDEGAISAAAEKIVESLSMSRVDLELRASEARRHVTNEFSKDVMSRQLRVVYDAAIGLS